MQYAVVNWKDHEPNSLRLDAEYYQTIFPGIAYHLNETPKKMIPSGGILRLKLKNKQINEDYLTLVLNSLIVQEQINRDVGGSVILHWRPDQVKTEVDPIVWTV